MKPMIAPTLLVCSLFMTLPALANKGADYKAPQPESSPYNLDWSKGWYIGAGVNADALTFFDVNGTTIPAAFSTDKVEINSNNAGFDVYIGREVNRYWAAEFGYSYVGNVDLKGITDGVKEQTAYARQWNLHAVGIGRLPLGYHMNFMYKGGLAWYFNSGKFLDIPTDVVSHNRYRGFALTYGAGLEVTWDQFVLRGDYTFMSPPENIQDDFLVTDLMGVSLIYKFI